MAETCFKSNNKGVKMANYFSYPEGIEKSIEWKINNKNAIGYVAECSKNGGILPKGIQIFQDYKNIEEDNKIFSWDAKEQVKVLLSLKENVVDFIIHLNELTSSTDKYENSIAVEKERMKGICFELAGVKEHDSEKAIELPDLYALANKTDDDNVNCICFYGDKPKLENCTHVAMHICGNGTLEVPFQETPP